MGCQPLWALAPRNPPTLRPCPTQPTEHGRPTWHCHEAHPLIRCNLTLLARCRIPFVSVWVAGWWDGFLAGASHHGARCCDLGVQVVRAYQEQPGPAGTQLLITSAWITGRGQSLMWSPPRIGQALQPLCHHVVTTPLSPASLPRQAAALEHWPRGVASRDPTRRSGRRPGKAKPWGRTGAHPSGRYSGTLRQHAAAHPTPFN